MGSYIEDYKHRAKNTPPRFLGGSLRFQNFCFTSVSRHAIVLNTNIDWQGDNVLDVVRDKKNEEQERHYYSDMRFVQISKNFWYDVCKEMYTSQDLLIYSTIKMLSAGTSSTDSEETSVITVDIILSMIKLTNTSRNKKSVVDSLAKLVEGKLIGIYDDFSFKSKQKEPTFQGIMYVMVLEKIPRGEYFIKLYTEEYNNIMNSGERNTSKLLMTYLTICVEVWEKGSRYTYITNADIVRLTGADKKTVTKQLKLLEELKVLCRKTLIIKDNHTKNVMTRYGWAETIKALIYN